MVHERRFSVGFGLVLPARIVFLKSQFNSWDHVCLPDGRLLPQNHSDLKGGLADSSVTGKRWPYSDNSPQKIYGCVLEVPPNDNNALVTVWQRRDTTIFNEGLNGKNHQAKMALKPDSVLMACCFPASP